MLTPNQNTGVLEQLPRGTDYLANVVSGIVFEEVNHSGDWRPYAPSGEGQCGVYGDTFACVTFSATNCLEVQLLEQKLPVNISDRFTARMSGTTKQGNYLTAVADSLRKDGFLDEQDWSWDRRGKEPMFTWDEFYKEIPQELKDKAKEMGKLWDIRYEWVGTDIDSLKKALKQAPLQIVTKVCGGWNTPPVAGCGIGNGHATTLLFIDEEGYHILDHYEPFIKVLSLDYGIGSAMKHVIKPLTKPKPMLLKGKGGLVRNTKTGGYGTNLGDIILDAGTERTGLQAMDILARLGHCTQLTAEEWDSVPHKLY